MPGPTLSLRPGSVGNGLAAAQGPAQTDAAILCERDRQQMPFSRLILSKRHFWAHARCRCTTRSLETSCTPHRRTQNCCSQAHDSLVHCSRTNALKTPKYPSFLLRILLASYRIALILDLRVGHCFPGSRWLEGSRPSQHPVLLRRLLHVRFLRHRHRCRSSVSNVFVVAVHVLNVEGIKRRDAVTDYTVVLPFLSGRRLL